MEDRNDLSPTKLEVDVTDCYELIAVDGFLQCAEQAHIWVCCPAVLEACCIDSKST